MPLVEYYLVHLALQHHLAISLISSLTVTFVVIQEDFKKSGKMGLESLFWCKKFEIYA